MAAAAAARWPAADGRGTKVLKIDGVMIEDVCSLVLWNHFPEANGTSQKVRAAMPLAPKIRSFWFQEVSFR